MQTGSVECFYRILFSFFDNFEVNASGGNQDFPLSNQIAAFCLLDGNAALFVQPFGKAGRKTGRHVLDNDGSRHVGRELF